MNCPYCQKPILAHKLEHTILSFLCEPCNANFSVANGEIYCIIWRNIVVDGKEYCAKMYPGSTGNAPEFIIYYHREVVPNQILGYDWQDLMRLDFIPQGWTPQNIKEKIKHHLVYL